MIDSHLLRVVILSLAISALGGCTTHGGIYTPAPGHRADSATKIPKGHMPPPGECRIWYSDLPPGQQPPPGNCRDLERRVPSGAILVRG